MTSTSTTASPSAATSVARPGSIRTKLLPSLGILLVAGGVLLLAWFAWLWFNPPPAPYRYELVQEGNADTFSQLGLEAWPDLALAKYEIRTEGVDQPLAIVHTARQGSAPPVMLDWENRTSELLLSTDSKLSELTTLASAIAKHAPKDALILAWWDTSRQIRLLAGRDTLFSSRLGEPLIVPAHWQNRSDSIRKYEDSFWGAAPDEKEQRQFQRFADALLADPEKGAAQLRELAGSREAYLAIHVTDLYKLGLLRPGQFEITYKHFPMEGNMHGLIGYVKNWMQSNNFYTYTLQSLSDKMVRGYFLRDDRSSHTLMAQMLPFTETMPLELTALQLIYQQGGYWVYRIPGDQPAADASPAASASAPES